MNYIAQLLGAVATYGLRADHASRELVDRAVEECAWIICKETGMKYGFFAKLKPVVVDHVLRSTLREPGECCGKNKSGTGCKKRTLFDYCDQHRDQELERDAKKRRVDLVTGTRTDKVIGHAVIGHTVIGHARFDFF